MKQSELKAEPIITSETENVETFQVADEQTPDTTMPEASQVPDTTMQSEAKVEPIDTKALATKVAGIKSEIGTIGKSLERLDGIAFVAAQQKLITLGAEFATATKTLKTAIAEPWRTVVNEAILAALASCEVQFHTMLWTHSTNDEGLTSYKVSFDDEVLGGSAKVAGTRQTKRGMLWQLPDGTKLTPREVMSRPEIAKAIADGRIPQGRVNAGQWSILLPIVQQVGYAWSLVEES